MRRPGQLARQRLDERLDGLGARIGPRPGRGWLRAIREALGMPTREMATRMGVSQARISQLERAEVDGSIRLDTLQRAAAALGCELCYVLVPAVPLEEAVRRQAEVRARVQVAATTQNMRLEAQEPETAVIEAQVATLADELVDTRGLWAAPTTGL